jgi:hypothetical protein
MLIKKTVPVPHNNVAALDSGIANKKHIATYHSAEYFTVTSERGLEIYDKSTETQPPKLVCVYPGDRFIVSSSDSDLEIYRF